MIVEGLFVKNYRNAAQRELALGPERNAFIGPNARGKTNLLEAIYFAGVGRSFRTARERELIKSDAPSAYICVTAKKDTGAERVEIVIDRSVNKRVAINGLPVSRMSELMGVVPVVLFCPDGLRIVKDAPADRRRFMDISLCQMSKTYFAALSQYGKILANRNKLLKSGGANDNTLAPWDMLLAEAGAKIIKSRRGFVRSLVPLAAAAHTGLFAGEALELEYEGVAGESLAEIAGELQNRYAADREADLRLKYTHTGPHKDDISICVNGLDLRAFGSQGQQRTAALAMKLAELKLLAEVLGTTPVLLLDDVFSELDGARRRALLSSLSGFQTIITATDDTDLDGYGVNIVNI